MRQSSGSLDASKYGVAHSFDAGAMTFGGSGAAREIAYDGGATCTDISLAIYNEVANFRIAKQAMIAALLTAGGALGKMAKNLPQIPGDPTTYFGWATLYAAGPALDVIFYNFEISRVRLDTYAVMFNANNCWTDSTPAPPGGGESSGSTCYVLVYYWVDTGEVYDEVPLGCTPN
jgi:hypothetical protein